MGGLADQGSIIMPEETAQDIYPQWV